VLHLFGLSQELHFLLCHRPLVQRLLEAQLQQEHQALRVRLHPQQKIQEEPPPLQHEPDG
jgi:hypothetical protein